MNTFEKKTFFSSVQNREKCIPNDEKHVYVRFRVVWARGAWSGGAGDGAAGTQSATGRAWEGGEPGGQRELKSGKSRKNQAKTEFFAFFNSVQNGQKCIPNGEQTCVRAISNRFGAHTVRPGALLRPGDARRAFRRRP